MASPNRHWPSLFKSKPCNTHHQWQHDINPACLLSAGCQKAPYSTVPVCEERSPEPKPRWNPKPEQIRILEAIFNSGMVNPPRDEIRKIRAQLQEYGQVGDANVFYWFQNRKSRSKHKLRHLQAARSHTRSGASAAAAPAAPSPPTITAPTASSATAATSSSSSSSDQSSASDMVPPSSIFPANMTSITDAMSAVPAATPASHLYFHSPAEFGGEQPFFPHCPPLSHYSSAADLSGIISSGLWGELMGQEGNKGGHGEDEAKTKMQLHHHGYGFSCTSTAAAGVASPIAIVTGVTAAAVVGDGGGATAVMCSAPASSCVAGPVNGMHGMGGGVAGVGGGVAARMVVFINEVPFEVATGLLNVWEAFGAEAVLLHSSGHPVLTDECGVTLHPLQHGASYYLV